jgi:hypothetical protein
MYKNYCAQYCGYGFADDDLSKEDKTSLLAIEEKALEERLKIVKRAKDALNKKSTSSSKDDE